MDREFVGSGRLFGGNGFLAGFLEGGAGGAVGYVDDAAAGEAVAREGGEHWRVEGVRVDA